MEGEGRVERGGNQVPQPESAKESRVPKWLDYFGKGIWGKGVARSLGRGQSMPVRKTL